MKKLVASFAAMLTFFSTAAAITSSAADEGAVIAVSDATVEIGKTFTVDVTLKDNPGIVAWHVYLDYNSEVFELTNFKAGDFSKEEAEQKGANESKPAPGPLDKVPFSMLWIDSLNGDYTSNGVLATLTFKVKDDAPAGKYTIEPSQDEDDFFDTDYVNQPFTTKAGTITVKEPVIAATGVSVTPTNIAFKKAGETASLTPTVSPEKATNKKVRYKSSNPAVATVDINGKVTAVAEGSAEITVTTDDGGYTAKCSVTVAHEHKMSKTAAKASTCTQQGNNEYYYCSGCKKYFKDDEGTKETTVDAEKLPLKEHDFTAQKTNADYLKSEATCVSKAVYYYSCTVCGEKGTKTFEYGEFDKTNHVGEKEVVGALEATCDKDGYTGDIVCKSCKEIIEEGKIIPAGHKFAEEWKYDEKEHWRECTVGCGTIIEKAEHRGGKATCSKAAVCEVCGAQYGEKDSENHDGGTEIKDYKAPTVDEEGYSGDTYCLGCGKKIKDGEILPKHVHKMEKVEAVEATEDKAGNIEYYRCTECEMLFKDEAGTQPLTLEETVIEKLPPKQPDNSDEEQNQQSGGSENNNNGTNAGEGNPTTGMTAAAAMGVLALGALGAVIASKRRK